MSNYIYSDEDNAPMNEEAFDRIEQNGHNPTVYRSYSEMKADEKVLPFTDPPEDGCWNCLNYDGDKCHAHWNNNDDCYYLPDRDDKEPTDKCELFERDESILPEEFFDA